MTVRSAVSILSNSRVTGFFLFLGKSCLKTELQFSDYYCLLAVHLLLDLWLEGTFPKLCLALISLWDVGKGRLSLWPVSAWPGLLGLELSGFGFWFFAI